MASHNYSPRVRPPIFLSGLLAGIFLTAGGASAADAGKPAYAESFESGGAEAGWKVQGNVRVDDEAVDGDRALALTKVEEKPQEAVMATGPAFAISPGNWQVQAAGRTDLNSMDNSYNGTLDFECLNAKGEVIDRSTVYIQFRKHNWERVSPVIEVPEGATAGRFVARINKETPGTFWIDELAVLPVAAAANKMRLMFNMEALGHLLYPTDPRKATIEVWSLQPLTADKATVSVRDYWGAEQAPAIEVPLRGAGEENGYQKYLGDIDLAALPLEVGRYYELHGSVARVGAEPHEDFSAFAILPEAPANAYKPEEIPFTSHSWDDRAPEHVKLSHRLGLRITGLVYQYNFKSPAKTRLDNAGLADGLGMGVLTGSLASSVERRVPPFDKITPESEKIMRESVRYEVKNFGHIRPLIIKMGNEPHNVGEGIKVNVDAYRIIYSEFKKLDPTIMVVGSSIGPVEDYFKAGFGEWCDAYDFHTYEDPEDIREIISVRYPEMFRKYGHPRPIWATEVGLNSQGMTRHAVAVALYKKFLNFFAAGGANVSWFSLLYPDPNAKIAETDPFSEAHNTFVSRFVRYAPKLDAIAYYNTVNAILDKKPVSEKLYPGDAQVFLFRNAKGNSLLAAYTKKGRQDVFVPLEGVGEVKVIRIDGTVSAMNAGGRGLTLTINEDPLILLFDGGPAMLADTLGKPSVKLAGASDRFVGGVEGHVDFALSGATPEQVSFKAPPLWKVERETMETPDGQQLRFRFTVPKASAAREADLTLNIASPNGGGALFFRPPVTSVLAVELLPLPAGQPDGPGTRLVIRNNGDATEKLAWGVFLDGQRSLEAGRFLKRGPAEAYFSRKAAGDLTLEPGKSAKVDLPLSEVNMFNVYDLRAVVRDASGRTTVVERPMGGFVGVPKAAAPPALDGNLDEGAWKNVSPVTVDNGEAFYPIHAGERMESQWKNAADLSARLRFLWDDKFLYVGVEVTDDLAGAAQPLSQLWNQDGLQLLIDPMRNSPQKVGKYDYAIAIGKDGPGAACHLSATTDIPTGATPAIRVSAIKRDPSTGSVTYEVAIPWANVAPFVPRPGANLGLHIAFNEDDGGGRGGYLSWFGTVQTKDIDTVGDLILLP